LVSTLRKSKWQRLQGSYQCFGQIFFLSLCFFFVFFFAYWTTPPVLSPRPPPFPGLIRTSSTFQWSIFGFFWNLLHAGSCHTINRRLGSIETTVRLGCSSLFLQSVGIIARSGLTSAESPNKKVVSADSSTGWCTTRELGSIEAIKSSIHSDW